MTCGYEHLDGAYVLGALSSTERLRFEDHLAGCGACRQAVQELAGLPGLLAKVPPDVWEPSATDDLMPVTLRPGLVALATRQRRRRRWVNVAAAAAAAVVVAAAGFAVGAQWAGRDEPAAQNPATSRPALGTAMVPVAAGSAMTADLATTTVAWGTRLELTCTYATVGQPEAGPYGGAATYALVVHTRDGQQERVATWRGLPGKTMHLAAATSTPRADIASVEVHDAEGATVLRTRT